MLMHAVLNVHSINNLSICLFFRSSQPLKVQRSILKPSINEDACSQLLLKKKEKKMNMNVLC